jgi:predicted O-methyltransferase YrrM
MAGNPWTEVDHYIKGLLIGEDAGLEVALRASAEAGLPSIHVSPAQGKLLHLLARLCGARQVLEIGTLGGYSTIWLARALPADGRVVTIEADPAHAAVARRNLAGAGVSASVDLRVGKALDLLPRLAAESRPPFDLIFIDADKAGIPEYFAWSLRLSRPGTAIVVDNVVRNGAVIDAASADPSVQGVRRLNQLLSSERRVSATTIQTVGAKGYDGFTLALVGDGG